MHDDQGRYFPGYWVDGVAGFTESIFNMDIVAYIDRFRIVKISSGTVEVEIIAYRTNKNGEILKDISKINMSVGDLIDIKNGDKKYQKILEKEFNKKP